MSEFQSSRMNIQRPFSQPYLLLLKGILLGIFCLPSFLFSQIDGGSNLPVVNSKYPPGQIRPDANLKLDREIATLNLDSIVLAIGYPKIALEAEIEGKVYVQILVSASGRYLKHQIVYSSHPSFLSRVEAEIKHLRFEPAVYKGVPQAYWLTIPFIFDLLVGNNPNTRSFRDRNLICRTLEAATEYKGACDVKELWISGTAFTQIPEAVFKLKELRYLDISYSGVTEISAQIQELQQLEVLSLMGNDLTDLPSELWALPKLRRVWISSNKFSEKTQKQFQKAHSAILYPTNEAGEIEW